MNTKFYLLPILLLAVLFASCEETSEASAYDNWQPRNEAYIDSLQTVYDNGTADKEGRKLERFELLTAPGKYMLFKRLTPVTATPPVDSDGKVIPGKESEYIAGYKYKEVKPHQTDKVSVYYKGTLITRTQFDGFRGNAPTAFDTPRTFAVYDLDPRRRVISGWTEVLQRMNVGDRWEVYIPWNYAYGSSGNAEAGILGYSTLIFDMQLYDIDSSGK